MRAETYLARVGYGVNFHLTEFVDTKQYFWETTSICFNLGWKSDKVTLNLSLRTIDDL